MNMERTWVSIDEWMDKEKDTIDYHSGHRKKENLAICNTMEGLWGYYAKGNMKKKCLKINLRMAPN